MKRTMRSVYVAFFAACLSTVHCGGDEGPPSGESPKADGQGGAGVGGSLTSGSGGAAGSGFGGFAGSGFLDSGEPRDCPAQRPPDTSSCSMRGMCHYPDGVCTCVRVDGQDANAREWICFDTVPRDAGTCPRDPPREGDSCMNPGLRCPGGDQGTICTCEAGDGSVEWHC